ncbi:MAG: peptidoglycan editing factor PgeF [Xanthomonadales bacterium]|nr:peptidoglycan editing factor PgeF [Xanthomonadales bacterium]
MGPGEPLAPRVRALAVTRAAPGFSQGAFARCNLGMGVGDDPAAVEANRRELEQVFGLPTAPCWLRQVHGCGVIAWDHPEAPAPGSEPEADAAWTARPGVVLAILSADCVPVLLAERGGDLVAAAHAGWRGLACGVLEALVAALPVPPAALVAWIGPAISAEGYEVGPEVREALCAREPRLGVAFRANARGRFQLDLALAAETALRAAGVGAVRHSRRFTDREPELFYSHRRDGPRTGRIASLVWIETGAR